MSRAPGFVRTEMFEPVPGTQDDHVVVFTFDGRDNLDAWLESPERQAIIDRIVDPRALRPRRGPLRPSW